MPQRYCHQSNCARAFCCIRLRLRPLEFRVADEALCPSDGRLEKASGLRASMFKKGLRVLSTGELGLRWGLKLVEISSLPPKTLSPPPPPMSPKANGRNLRLLKTLVEVCVSTFIGLISIVIISIIIIITFIVIITILRHRSPQPFPLLLERPFPLAPAARYHGHEATGTCRVPLSLWVSAFGLFGVSSSGLLDQM